MYNGIGLLTPRGSGTSGYVTSNRFNLKRAPTEKNDQRRDEVRKQRKPNEEILEHNKKREIEVKLYELRLKLEDEDKLPADQVEERLAMERGVLEEQYSKEKEQSKTTTQETHEVARRKMEQMEKLRKALGIAADVKEGEAFDGELQERKRKEAAEKREMERERRHKDRREFEEATEKRRKDRPRLRELERKTTPSPRRERSRELPRRREGSRERDARWASDHMDRNPPPIDHQEGRRERPDDRGVLSRRYSNDGQPGDYRHHDLGYRERYHDRGPPIRGRGRRYPGRGYRPSEPGYYRIGEEAPERYDPSVETERRQEKQERWEKIDIDAEEEPVKESKPEYPPEGEPTRVGMYMAEYDAHAALGTYRGRLRERPTSPAPRSPNSMKGSPSQPKHHRKAADYRSDAPSPISPSELKATVRNERTAGTRSRSPSPRRLEERKEGGERRRSASSDKSDSRSASKSRSSRSVSSDRGRRRDRSIDRRRSPRWRDDRSRGDRRMGGYRPRRPYEHRGHFGGYRGYRRPGYGYPGWRSNRRYNRRSPSRSRERRRRSRSFSRSSSSDRSDRGNRGGRKRRSSSSLSRKSTPSDKHGSPSKSPLQQKAKD